MNSLIKTITLWCVILITLVQEGRTQQCDAGTAINIKGNWYCSSVDSISYTNFPGTGHYNVVTHMNTTTGSCTTEKYVYSGSLSPLNEEVGQYLQLILEHRLIIITIACSSYSRSDLAQTIGGLCPRPCMDQAQLGEPFEGLESA